MRAEEVVALAAVRALYEEPVIYTGAGLNGEIIGAIPSEERAPPFQGAGSTLRSLSFEVAYSTLPERPRKGNEIVWKGKTYSVDDITEHDDIEAWGLGVQL